MKFHIAITITERQTFQIDAPNRETALEFIKDLNDDNEKAAFKWTEYEAELINVVQLESDDYELLDKDVEEPPFN